MMAEANGDAEAAARPLTLGSMIKEIQNLKEKFKDEDSQQGTAFEGLEKATVLQECRDFHNSQVVMQEPQKCCLHITKLLYILIQGDAFTSTEITEVFFGVTKLFQSTNVNLRRMVYLFIKEVAEACDPDDVVIVTACLTRDMHSQEDLFRANAIRVLAKIIDASMLNAIERYVKQAIVDHNHLVASSALVSAQRLMRTAPEVVRRWVNEVQEAVNSSSEMVQFHALALLYQLKQHDKLAISKLVAQLTRSNLRSAPANCLLIRYIARLLHDDVNATNARSAYQFLESCLRHRSEMVIYEAARAIVNLPGVDMGDIAPAITVLQLFLSSPKPTLRFAAMRTLSRVAASAPSAVAKCNSEMEALLSDSNRSIATLALTTLLKTGTEVNIDGLMKQIATFMGEIADEFKIVVVRAMREVCLKYPNKHRVLVGFLATFLREEGGFEFKRCITDCIVELMSAIPETKESSLLHLCEFIEDCEFTALSTQVLHLIGTMGPATTSPARYIRFVYNRVILENPSIRAAAVTALGHFGAACPELAPSIEILLRRSMSDEDDEVRDRALLALASFKLDPEIPKNETNESKPALLPGVDGEPVPGLAKQALVDPIPMSLRSLSQAVKLYSQSPANGEMLTLDNLPIVEEENVSHAAAAAAPIDSGMPSLGGASSAPVESQAEKHAKLYEIPAFAKHGRIFRSAQPTPLTESETEYTVSATKHIFEDGTVVLEFLVCNTIDVQILKNVSVAVAPIDPGSYVVGETIEAPSALYGEPVSTYVILECAEGEEGAVGPATFGCELHFTVYDIEAGDTEVDEDVEGYPEEYPLEDLEIFTSDFMAKVSVVDFRRSWEGSDQGEVVEKFALQFNDLSAASTAVIDFLGMQVCDGGIQMGKSNYKAMIHLSGVFFGGVNVLARAALSLEGGAAGAGSSEGCILKIAVRSSNPEISQLVADCIR